MGWFIVILILIGAGWEFEQWFVSHRDMKLWEKAGKPCSYKDWAEYVKANGCPGACDMKCAWCDCRAECPLCNKKDGDCGQLEDGEDSEDSKAK